MPASGTSVNAFAVATCMLVTDLKVHIWWVWRSWLARQIVALEALGSSPSTHPIGLSPSGKATAFDAVIRWFESS